MPGTGREQLPPFSIVEESQESWHGHCRKWRRKYFLHPLQIDMVHDIYEDFSYQRRCNCDDCDRQYRRWKKHCTERGWGRIKRHRYQVCEYIVDQKCDKDTRCRDRWTERWNDYYDEDYWQDRKRRDCDNWRDKEEWGRSREEKIIIVDDNNRNREKIIIEDTECRCRNECTCGRRTRYRDEQCACGRRECNCRRGGREKIIIRDGQGDKIIINENDRRDQEYRSRKYY